MQTLNDSDSYHGGDLSAIWKSLVIVVLEIISNLPSLGNANSYALYLLLIVKCVSVKRTKKMCTCFFLL